MRRARLAAALLLAAACAPAPPPISHSGPPPVRLRGLDFSAELDVSSGGPTRMAGEVRVANRGGAPETLVFADGCPVRLRVYDTHGERVAPVWDGPLECPATPVELAIAPGESARLPIPATGAQDILGTELTEGTYRVTVWLAPAERVIEIEAGDVELRSR